MSNSLEIAALRMLTLQDVGLSAASGPEAVKEQCNLIAADLSARYLSGSMGWHQADTCANHIYDLMLLHCGPQMPELAWDVFLASDEGEVDDRGDAHTRPLIAELMRKRGAA